MLSLQTRVQGALLEESPCRLIARTSAAKGPAKTERRIPGKGRVCAKASVAKTGWKDRVNKAKFTAVRELLGNRLHTDGIPGKGLHICFLTCKNIDKHITHPPHGLLSGTNKIKSFKELFSPL